MSPDVKRRLAERRRRVSRIRRTVVGAAVAVFIAAFSTVYVQMQSGDDPALATSGSGSTAVVATSAAQSSSSTQTSSSRPAPVTTRQS